MEESIKNVISLHDSYKVEDKFIGTVIKPDMMHHVEWWAKEPILFAQHFGLFPSMILVSFNFSDLFLGFLPKCFTFQVRRD